MMKEELTLPAEIFRLVPRCASPRPRGCRYSSITRLWAERRASAAFPTQNPLVWEEVGQPGFDVNMAHRSGPVESLI